jgi:YidC/Oxa1 family membrane protein insertase
MIGNLFFKILYQPLFNALIYLYQNFSFWDLGVAIILLTLVIRIILFPLFYKGAKDQSIMQRLAPKIKEIQTSHKDNKEMQAQALLALYKEHKVNPFSGFLLLLVQLPILWALYRVFLNEFSPDSFSALYSFILAPESINRNFLGMFDLASRSAVIALIASLFQYLQGKISLIKSSKPLAEQSPMERMGRQMMFMGPVMTFAVLYFFNLPSAVGIYWMTTAAFSLIQQVVINKKLNVKKMEREEVKEIIEEEKIRHSGSVPKIGFPKELLENKKNGRNKKQTQ